MRFTVRILMIAVAIAALLIAASFPALRSYRRWSFHRERASKYKLLERRERLLAEQEKATSIDRAAIRTSLMKKPGFTALNPDEQETAIFAEVFSHRVRSRNARIAAAQAEENRRWHEEAAASSWYPFAPAKP